MNRRTRYVMSVVTASALAGAALITTKPALANEAMQIQVCQNANTDFEYVFIETRNQDGLNTSRSWQTDPKACTTTWDWWAQGHASLTWYNSASNKPDVKIECYVPEAPKNEKLPGTVICPVP